MRKLLDALCPYILGACLVIGTWNMVLRIQETKLLAETGGRCEALRLTLDALEGG